MSRIFITCRVTRGRVIPFRLKSKVKISPNAFLSSVKARQRRGGRGTVGERGETLPGKSGGGGEYLADQLVLPMALAGAGEFTVAHPHAIC